MNCTICGEPIVLSPSAKHRAKRDATGKSVAFYVALFTEHTDCVLKKRSEQASQTMRQHCGVRNDSSK